MNVNSIEREKDLYAERSFKLSVSLLELNKILSKCRSLEQYSLSFLDHSADNSRKLQRPTLHHNQPHKLIGF